MFRGQECKVEGVHIQVLPVSEGETSGSIFNLQRISRPPIQAGETWSGLQLEVCTTSLPAAHTAEACQVDRSSEGAGCNPCSSPQALR